MARKLISTINGDHFIAKVYRDTEWDEYVVRYFDIDALKFMNQMADYHTDDREDAISTANTELRRMEETARNQEAA